MAQKFYVVWSGRKNGVFSDWTTAHQAVDRYPGARFKAFSTLVEAEQAYRAGFVASPRKSSPAKKTSAEKGAAHVAHRYDVSIYCDGACEPNPGNAGSGVVLYRNGELAELWYGLYNSAGTNNTAELNALREALRMAEVELEADQTVEICSDSQYSIQCVRDWAPSWERRGWKKAGGEIKNLEIIQACYEIYQRIKAEVHLTHVAAHVGTEGNELADRMAMYGAQQKERELRLFDGDLDITAILKMRAG